MNRSSLLAVLLLAAVTAGTSSQSPGQTPSPQSSPAAQTGQSSQPGAQQLGANPPSPQPSKTAVPGSGTNPSGAGPVNTPSGQAQISEAPETPSVAPALSNSDLQTQIQNALTKEPTLTGDTVNVSVSAEAIDITGSVASAREKLTATRIVQSYAGNRKVMSHLTVSGHNRTASPDAPVQSGEEHPGKSDSSSQPDSTKGIPTTNSSRPQR